MLRLGYSDRPETRECPSTLVVKEARAPRIKDPVTLPEQAVVSGETYTFDIS